MEINKEQLLGALQTIYEEYLRAEHIARLDTCSLCEIYYDYGCAACPMYVFLTSYSKIYFPCMSRKCQPYNCGDKMTIDELALQKCIEFYKAIVPTIKSMSEEELNAPDAFQWMIDVDKEIANKIENEYCHEQK